MTPQYCRLSRRLLHLHTEVTIKVLDAKHLLPMPQKGFLWNMQTWTKVTCPLHCSVSQYVTSAPLETEVPTPCSEVRDKLFLL